MRTDRAKDEKAIDTPIVGGAIGVVAFQYANPIFAETSQASHREIRVYHFSPLYKLTHTRVDGIGDRRERNCPILHNFGAIVFRERVKRVR